MAKPTELTLFGGAWQRFVGPGSHCVVTHCRDGCEGCEWDQLDDVAGLGRLDNERVVAVHADMAGRGIVLSLPRISALTWPA